jgi:Mg/Co/Ni transporter MgtE
MTRLIKVVNRGMRSMLKALRWLISSGSQRALMNVLGVFTAPVIDDDGCCLGVVTVHDLIRK